MLRRTVLPLLLAGSVVVGLATGCSSDGSDGAAPFGTTAELGATSTSTTSTSSSSSAQEAVPSTGCEGEQPAPGRTEETVQSGGDERSYVRYVPAGIDATAPAPLVLDLTAYSPASLEEGFSGFTTKRADGTVLADEEGAVVITPEPTNGAGALLT